MKLIQQERYRQQSRQQSAAAARQAPSLRQNNQTVDPAMQYHAQVQEFKKQ